MMLRTPPSGMNKLKALLLRWVVSEILEILQKRVIVKLRREAQRTDSKIDDEIVQYVEKLIYQSFDV